MAAAMSELVTEECIASRSIWDLEAVAEPTPPPEPPLPPAPAPAPAPAPPPPYDPVPMCAELVEEVFTSLPLTYADEKPKRVPLLKAVDFDGMIVGTTHWAKQVPLHGWVAGIGEDDEEAFTWVRIAQEEALDGHFASVTKNHLHGPRIEYFDRQEFGGELVQGIKPVLKSGSSHSGGHVEFEGGIVLAHGGGDAEDRNALNYTLAVGVTTGAGIKDDSASIKLLGCGITVGRKMSMSFFDSEVGVDLGKVNKDRKEKGQLFFWEDKDEDGKLDGEGDSPRAQDTESRKTPLSPGSPSSPRSGENALFLTPGRSPVRLRAKTVPAPAPAESPDRQRAENKGMRV